MHTNNLEIGKCLNCKKFWEIKKLKQVTFLEPLGDGLIRKKKLMCLDCFKNIEFGLKSQKTQVEKDL
jgi:hypothetical protein